MEENNSQNIFIIRKIQPEDLEEVLVIERECRLSPWDLKSYSEELERDDSIPLAAVSENKVVGFLILRLTGSQEGEIYNVGVSEKYRNKGIAGSLLNQALEIIWKEPVKSENKILWLEVRESNQPAISFYEKHGFKIQGRRKRFYSNPVEDAFIMNKEIFKDQI